MKRYGALVAGCCAAAIAWIVSRGHATPYDNYVLLAQAWTHGRSWIDWPGPYIDALAYGGRHYIIEAPMPAVILFPLLALFGFVNQTAVGIALTGVAVGAAWELCARIGLSVRANAWICAFLLAGTDLLWCAMLGDVWMIAHVSAVCFTMLVLVELAGKRRGWLVALWAACAFESRFSLALAVPVYAACLVLAGDGLAPHAQWRTRLGSFAAVLVPVAGLWLWYDLARWGTWYDIGYTAWYHQDVAGQPYGSPFQMQYVPMQLWSFFVQAPQRVAGFPYLQPTLSGVALTWTSPALILALRARRPQPAVVALWILALVTAVPNFLYYVNGYAQFGMRHALDFAPFLVALMALGVRDGFPRWGYILIAYSVLAGFWGLAFWTRA